MWRKGSNTTPESTEIQSLFSDMKKENVECAVMEVSSHALDQGRVEGIDFDCAIFTNLTHDHLDYHGDFRAYRQAKTTPLPSLPQKSAKERKWAMINIDDPSAPALIPPPPIDDADIQRANDGGCASISLREGIDGLPSAFP